MVCDNSCVLSVPIPHQNLDRSRLGQQRSLLPGEPEHISESCHRRTLPPRRVPVGRQPEEMLTLGSGHGERLLADPYWGIAPCDLL